MVPEAGRFRTPACRLDNPDILPERLAKAIQLLPENACRATEKGPSPAGTERQEDEFTILRCTKEYGYVTMPNGRIARRENNALVRFTGLGEKRTERIKGLLRVRDAARAYLDAQSRDGAGSELENARDFLNQAYDRFVARHGPINSRANQLALADDPDLPFLCALEDYEPATQHAIKTAFFEQRTLDTEKEIVRADTATDALVYSLHQHGKVDMVYMSSLTAKPVESLTDELAGRIFLNPETGQWETADDYLSGDVVRKLRAARKLKRPDLAANVAALESVQPAPLGPGEIAVKLGAPWIPPQVVQQFVEDLLTR
jgi:N12 class adenine-specific DNA methylase